MKESMFCEFIEIRSRVTYLNSKPSLQPILIKMVDSMPEHLPVCKPSNEETIIFHTDSVCPLKLLKFQVYFIAIEQAGQQIPFTVLNKHVRRSVFGQQ